MAARSHRVWGEDAPPALAYALSGVGAVAALAAAFLWAAVYLPAGAALVAPPPPPPPVVVVTATPTPTPTPTPEPEPTPTPTPTGPPTCAPILLCFGYDSAEAAPAVVRAARALGEWLQAHPDASVTLDGHADSVGAMERNLALSHERAQRVAFLLRRAGVARERITARGFGAYQPLEGTPESSAENRRVEVQVKGAMECPSETRKVVVP